MFEFFRPIDEYTKLFISSKNTYKKKKKLRSRQFAEYTSPLIQANFCCHPEQVFQFDYRNRIAYLKAFFDADQL